MLLGVWAGDHPTVSEGPPHMHHANVQIFWHHYTRKRPGVPHDPGPSRPSGPNDQGFHLIAVVRDAAPESNQRPHARARETHPVPRPRTSWARFYPLIGWTSRCPGIYWSIFNYCLRNKKNNFTGQERWRRREAKLSSQHVAQVRPHRKITFLPLDPLPCDARLAGAGGEGRRDICVDD